MTEQEFTLKLLSGEIAVNERGTFYFDRPGNHFDDKRGPKFEFLHRTDGPAAEWADGSKSWYVDGRLHRTNGPAAEWADGSKSWFVNGVNVSLECLQPNSTITD